MPISRDLYTSNLPVLKRAYLMEMLIESHKKKSEHSIYIHGVPDRIVFPNKRSNVY